MRIKHIIAVCALAVFGAAGAHAQNHDDIELASCDHVQKNAFRPGEVLVKFKDSSGVVVRRTSKGKFASSSITSLDQVLQNFGVEEMEQLMPLTGKTISSRKMVAYNGKPIQDVDMSNVYCIRFSESDSCSVFDVVNRLDSLEEVEYAEPNYLVYTMVVEDGSNDPMFSQQSYLNEVKAPSLWDKPTIDGHRPVIAIIDTGVDINHPDLKDNIWTNEKEHEGSDNADDDGNGLKDDIHGWDFVNQTGEIGDWNGHGTHCAGIAAAVGGNGVGIIGANPDALIMPITVMQSDGTGDVATIIKGIDYASANGADVISMSIGSYTHSIAEEQALAKAYSKSVLVAAAGNDGGDINGCHLLPLGPSFPAAFSFVLGVQAYGAEFSNYDCNGPIYSSFDEEKLYNYELQAPGISLLSTYLENFADSVRWQLQKVSAEKEKISAGTLRLLGGVSLWQ